VSIKKFLYLIERHGGLLRACADLQPLLPDPFRRGCAPGSPLTQGDVFDVGLIDSPQCVCGMIEENVGIQATSWRSGNLTGPQ
jgi:hypothetical protein